jgi:type IV pilus assembly protein PilQ
MQGHSKAVLIVTLVFMWLGRITFAAGETPITLRLTNADVNAVLRTLASMGGVSLVVDDSVTGKITLQLEEVPFQEALEIVTKSKNLAVQKIGNTLIVATPEKINKGFGSIHVIKLQYAKGEEVKKSLALIIPEEKIKVDAASNCILFSGTPSEYSEVERAVTELDRQLAQVIIEAEVIEIYRDSLKDIGLEWDWTTIPYQQSESSSSDDDSSDEKTYKSVRLFDDIHMGLSATLKAKISKGEGKVLAKPRIMALNNKDARIHIGNKVPVVEYDNEGNKSTSYIEVGIKLDITPQISENNSIVSKVKTEVSDATYSSSAGGYEISTRESETTVRLQDGETLVIGGLYNSTNKKSSVKVPLLGDIPLIGNLFKSKSLDKQDTEIIVLLKPTIAKSQQ